MPSPVLSRALAAAVAVLIGCSTGACERTQQGEARVLVIGSDLKVVDPAAGPLTDPQAVLLANAAQGLVRFDARGQIEPGLAERWNVSDDGLSYVFRLQSAEWPNGGKITAQQVARLLRQQIATRSKNALKDTLGALGEIVAMTDRVIEIRLKAPRPSLLQLLAQPEFGIVRDAQGTGPFRIADEAEEQAGLELERTITSADGEDSRREEVSLAAAAAPSAVQAFLDGKTDLVLGGTFSDLPYARAEDMPRNALRFDPASGLFGLVPTRASGPLSNPELRRLLSQAIDRQGLIDALNIPGLLPRASLLEPGLEGVPDPLPPDWMALPIEQRRAQLAASAARQFGGTERTVIRIALPDAPGANILLRRLTNDWRALRITVERAGKGQPADLELVDAVAPSASPAWFVRRFRCGLVPICDEKADELMDGARAATIPAQRNTLLAQAAQLIDTEQLFIPLAAPIRWSLVSARVHGFATNRFARHTLTGLTQRLNRERVE